MRHTLFVAVLLSVCTSLFGQNQYDTYFFDGTTMEESSFLTNTDGNVGIGITPNPLSPFALEVAGDMRNKLIGNNFFAETTSDDFAQMSALSPPAPSFGAGSGNYYLDPLGEYTLFSGVLEATARGASHASGNFIFNADGGNTGIVAGRYMGSTENFLHIQHIFNSGTNLEKTHAIDLENSIFKMYTQEIDITGPSHKFYNGFSLEDDNAAMDAYDGTTGTALTFMLHSTDGLYLANNTTTFDRMFRIMPDGETIIKYELNVGENLNVDEDVNVVENLSVGGVVTIGSETIMPSTTHDDFTLSVSGKIVTKELVVTVTPWADFVFEDDYQLKPLSEVKSFIETNGHLPDVPSAQEVSENGIDLGKTNAMLLMKIEELTLYLLQQQEQIDALKKQIEE